EQNTDCGRARQFHKQSIHQPTFQLLFVRKTMLKTYGIVRDSIRPSLARLHHLSSAVADPALRNTLRTGKGRDPADPGRAGGERAGCCDKEVITLSRCRPAGHARSRKFIDVRVRYGETVC